MKADIEKDTLIHGNNKKSGGVEEYMQETMGKEKGWGEVVWLDPNGYK